jgi:hypothetical protein
MMTLQGNKKQNENENITVVENGQENKIKQAQKKDMNEKINLTFYSIFDSECCNGHEVHHANVYNTLF